MPIRYNPDLRPLITDWLTPDEGEEMYLAKVQTRLLIEGLEAEVEHLRAIIRNFLNAEEVLTRPVFREAPGPPFDTWIALQNRNEALDVLRTEAAKGGKP